MIAPSNPLQTTSEAAEDGSCAEHVRRQRFFQQDTRRPASVASAPLSSILVPSENGEELEPLVCRMD